MSRFDGNRTRWDRIIAFAAFRRYLRPFLAVEGGDGEEVSILTFKQQSVVGSQAI
jgi:hypothetical protein